MDLKLAKDELNSKAKTISLDKVMDEIRKNDGNKFFYFDNTNSHKDMTEALEILKSQGFSIYFREIRYGLDDNDYMYEIHAV